MRGPDPFDLGAVRTLRQRSVFVRRVEVPTLVLGSTQRALAVERDAPGSPVAVVRRRSGGGAVLLEPGRAVWMDTWVPREDALFDDDVSSSRQWVGRWWADALDADGLEVHAGRPIRTPWSGLICFGGVDAGEVVRGGRKVVGVAQWRGREGALTHSLAYLEVDWARLSALLGLGADIPAVVGFLEARTATVRDLGADVAEGLAARLLRRLPDPDSWRIEGATS